MKCLFSEPFGKMFWMVLFGNYLLNDSLPIMNKNDLPYNLSLFNKIIMSMIKRITSI